MKFGFRKPSLRRRLSARTSWKRYVRHSLGFKAPRGWGWLTNPKKALYNRVYYRTTVDPIKLLMGGRRRRRKSQAGCLVSLLALIVVMGVGAAGIRAGAALRFSDNKHKSAPLDPTWRR